MNYAVIVDFSHMWHMCMHAAVAAGPQYDIFRTTIANIEGKLRTTERALAKLGIRGYDLVFAEDRPAMRKMKLFPSYKGEREDRSAEKAKAKEYLREHGFKGKFCYSQGNEADDVIATLVRLSKQQQGLCTVIVSADKDLWQLLGPTTIIWNPVTKLVTTADELEKCFGFRRPDLVPLHKALWGDSGDGIPNAVPRMQRHLMPVLTRCATGTLEELTENMSAAWPHLSQRCRELYEVGSPQVAINYELVKLDDRCPLKWE